jgi:cysteine desulfurase/selenocysteine lyase
MSMTADARHTTPDEKRPTDGLDVNRIKADFPILSRLVHDHRLVYLDNAATTQKPQAVIDAISDYYSRHNANVHRGLHALSDEATEAYEKSRRHAADFVGGVSEEQMIFTRGATEAINLVAYTWGEQNLKAGDEIILSEMEHHANLVPWVILAKKKGAVIKTVPFTGDGYLDLDAYDRLLSPCTRLVAVTHMSNVLGTINPVQEIVRRAHQRGAVTVIDGAQAAPHLAVNVGAIDPDFYVFSAHKMLGPTGVGVLYGRRELLESIPPFNMGGEMIREVTFDRVTWNELPHKFEAGTPNIADVIAFDAALSYLEEIGMDTIRSHEKKLTEYAIHRLSELGDLQIHGPKNIDHRGGVISFVDANVHPHDISTFLDSKGIAIRAGHHCAQPLVKKLGHVATSRASLYIYNDEKDIDALYEALVEMGRFFG